MSRLWIEIQADSLETPLPFATWFVREGVKTYDEIDDALVEYFQSRGVEEVEEIDNIITLRAGVQEISFQIPLWYQYFADNIGYEIKDWFGAVCELLRFVAEDWSDAKEARDED
jgi:hypothetical protein